MKSTIILVHGAFAESSSWNAVAGGCSTEGHRVIAYANPLRTIAGDSGRAGRTRAHASTAPSCWRATPTVVPSSRTFPPTPERSSASSTSRPSRSTGREPWRRGLPRPRRDARRTLKPLPLPAAVSTLHRGRTYHVQFCADLPVREAAAAGDQQRPITEAALDGSRRARRPCGGRCRPSSSSATPTATSRSRAPNHGRPRQREAHHRDRRRIARGRRLAPLRDGRPHPRSSALVEGVNDVVQTVDGMLPLDGPTFPASSPAATCSSCPDRSRCEDGRIVDGIDRGPGRGRVREHRVDPLQHAGASLNDVVRCGVYVADLGDLPRDAAYAAPFGEQLPARTTVGVELPGYGVEIDCIAVIPSSESGRPA